MSAPPRTDQANHHIQTGGAPGSPTSTQPSYPLSVGGDFYVSATASSGLPVSITPIAGAVAIVPPAPSAIPWPPGTSEYRVNGPGTVILKAEQNGAAGYDAAQPVSLSFGVGPSSSDATCNGLFPSGSAQADCAAQCQRRRWIDRIAGTFRACSAGPTNHSGLYDAQSSKGRRKEDPGWVAAAD